MVNNYDWYKDMSAIQFLRGIGKHFRVSTMLQKDSVKNRLADSGLSFTEFSYQILQSYDFYHLFQYVFMRP
jgi:tyrosyl-tRNA synthetase